MLLLLLREGNKKEMTSKNRVIFPQNGRYFFELKRERVGDWGREIN